VVLAEKPVIADTSSNLEPALLDILLANLSTLSSVYHKPPEVSFGPDSVAQVCTELSFSNLKKRQTKLQPKPRQSCQSASPYNLAFSTRLGLIQHSS